MQNKIKFLSYGILAALGALALESLILVFPGIPLTSGMPAWFMPIGVLIEESMALFLIVKLFHEMKPGKTFFSLSLLFGVGFSLPEILLDMANYGFPGHSDMLPYLGLLLVHAASAGIFGYHLAQKGRLSYTIILFFILAYSAHLIYNLSVINNFSPGISLVIPIFVISACFFLMQLDAKKVLLPEEKN